MVEEANPFEESVENVGMIDDQVAMDAYMVYMHRTISWWIIQGRRSPFTAGLVQHLS